MSFLGNVQSSSFGLTLISNSSNKIESNQQGRQLYSGMVYPMLLTFIVANHQLSTKSLRIKIFSIEVHDQQK